MKIRQLADKLGVSRQYVDFMTKKLGMEVPRPHGVKWLTKPQIKTLTYIIKKKDIC